MTACSAWVLTYKEDVVQRQCARSGTHAEENALWCSQHRPSVVKAKKCKANAEARAGFVGYDAREKARAARDALGQALLEAGQFDDSHAPLAQAYAEALVAWKAAKTELAEKFGKVLA